jgi:hypothetical protein
VLERPEGPLELAPYGVAAVQCTRLLDRAAFESSPVITGGEGGDAPRV